MSAAEEQFTVFTPPSGLDIYHSGPSLDKGPLPALFYFALSGKDSLQMDPYNQPVAFLKGTPIRKFSFTLPLHDNECNYQHAIGKWAGLNQSDPYFLEKFFDLCLENIEYLIRQKLADPKKLAAGGLSRGGFVAAHLAARDRRIHTVLAFAPMTGLENVPEFKELSHDPIVQALNLKHHISELASKQIKCYIGNRDVRVGTRNCFELIAQLTDAAYEKGIRSPPIELVLFPSIGHKGHGTPAEIFRDGAKWLESLLLVSSLA